MPYEIKQGAGGYAVVKQGTATPIKGGCHPTKAAALAHLRALYVNVSDAAAWDEGKHHRKGQGPGGGEFSSDPGGGAPAGDSKRFLARYDKWRAGLTPAQDTALRFWQSPGFALMNGQLRGQDPGKLKADEHASDKDLARAKKASRDFKAAIAAAPPLEEPLTAYRAFSAAQFGDLKPGDKITDKGFVAMSLMNDVTAVGRAGQQAAAAITLPAGTKVGAGSAREIDLAPPATFTVTGVHRAGGKTHYQLTYVPKGQR